MSYIPINIPFFLDEIEEENIEKLKVYADWYLNILTERISMLAKEVQSTAGYDSWKPNLSEQSLDVLSNWFCTRMRALETKVRPSDETLHLLQGWFFQNVIPEVHGITPDQLFERFKNWYLKALETDPRNDRAGELAMEWFYKNVAAGNVEGNEDLKIFEEQWKSIALHRTLDPLTISYSADVGMYLSKVFYRFVKQNYPQVKWHPAFGNHQYIHYYSHVEVLEKNALTLSFDPIISVIKIGRDMHLGIKSASSLRKLYDLWVNCMPIYIDQFPILTELAADGVKVKSLWDFRYVEDPQKRKVFPKAVPILCKHLKLPHDFYILEAIAAAFTQEDIGNPITAQAALEVLERKESLPRSVEGFLIYAAMKGDSSQEAKAHVYLNNL